MDLKDKYLGIWVTRTDLETIFSLEPVSAASRFLVAGTVVGEAMGVGLWVQLETVSTLGEQDIFPDLAKERPRRLIRSDFIYAAELFGTRARSAPPSRSATTMIAILLAPITFAPLRWLRPLENQIRRTPPP